MPKDLDNATRPYSTRNKGKKKSSKSTDTVTNVSSEVSDSSKSPPTREEFLNLSKTVVELTDLIKTFSNVIPGLVNTNVTQNENVPCSSDLNPGDKVNEHGLVSNDMEVNDSDQIRSQNQPREHSATAGVSNLGLQLNQNDNGVPSLLINQFVPTQSSQMNQRSNGAPLSLNQIDDTINSHLSSLINQEETYAKPGNYIPTDLPVDLKVSDKSRNLIWSNQYIDLAVLLDPSLEINKPKNDFAGLLGDYLPSVPRKTTRYITSLGQWCSAFTVFITIYCQKYPSELPHLFTYMNTVKKLAHRNGSYLTYDEEFRYLKQSQPLQWNVTHTGLWMECRDNQKNQKNGKDKKQNSNKFQNSDYSVKKPSHPRGHCFRYHTHGKCDRNNCEYKHFCYNQLCNNDEHPFSKCPYNRKPFESTQFKSTKPNAPAMSKSK